MVQAIQPRFQIANGHIHMTDKPGLGLSLNWDFVNAHRVGD